MKSKRTFNLIFILGILLYSISFIATSIKKTIQGNPCDLELQSRINSDTALGNYVFFNNIDSDTLVLSGDTLLPANWNKITDTICKIYNINCTNNTNKPILIINNRVSNQSNWDTRFGKKVYFKLCP